MIRAQAIAFEIINGRLTEWRAEVTRRYTNQKLLINKDFGKHSISGLIAYEFNDYYYKNLDVYGTGFVPGFEVLDVVSKPERYLKAVSTNGLLSLISLNGNMYMMVSILPKPLSAGTIASNLGTNAKQTVFCQVVWDGLSAARTGLM